MYIVKKENIIEVELIVCFSLFSALEEVSKGAVLLAWADIDLPIEELKKKCEELLKGGN